VNHHHNCLLCHAPATATREKTSQEDIAKLEGLTAQVPVPSESMVAYYRPSSPDILVRFDVTYLRQDFSLKLKVADADPWPELQRYDFLVRTREVTDQEARTIQKLLQPSQPNVVSPYQSAALSALRALTGMDTLAHPVPRSQERPRVQGVISSYDPGSGDGVILCDTDLREYDLAADALAGSLFRMLRQGQRVIFDLDDAGAATKLRLGSEADMGTPGFD